MLLMSGLLYAVHWFLYTAIAFILSLVTIQASIIMLQFDWTSIPAFVLIVVGLSIGTEF